MPDRPPRRPRFNWFAPLPPAHTEIAQHVLRALPAVARHVDVTLWTDQEAWSSEVDAYATVRRWPGAAWAELNAADATLFDIGNNPLFHGWIWEVARRHPGIVVLHDIRLHGLFAGQLLDVRRDEQAYLDAVRRHHGDGAVADAQRLLRGETTAHAIAEDIPLAALALDRARGAIVHTTAAFAEISALGLCPVVRLDLPYAPGPPPPPRPWDGTLRLVMFGYIGANRRVFEVLEAIATFPERPRLRLDIVGPVHDSAAVEARIQALGVGDLVRLRGFIPEAELAETLDRARLAVNLRYPSMGEASASQLRVFGRGLASLVTRTGWYAELPAAAVGFVDPWTEIADLHRHFSRALADPGILEGMGEAGRRHLAARHDPERYARELVTGVERMMRTPASIAGVAAGAVARVMTASGMPAGARAAVSRRAAEELSRWVQ